MRLYLAAATMCLLSSCGARQSAAPSPCSGFRAAEGPYATLGPTFTALPAAVQFEAERDVISLGEIPRVIVRAGDAGIGRFKETSEFTVTNPDGTKNEGPCDPAREPGSSGGFAALNFKCHPFTQVGMYTIRFEPAHNGLPGGPVELCLRVVDAAPKTPAAPAGWQTLSLTSLPPQLDCYDYGESYVAALDHGALVTGAGTPSPTRQNEVASRAALARREGLSRARVSQVLNQIRGAVARRQRAG
jgi:hypothetical protein